jgi:hypothetical protein
MQFAHSRVAVAQVARDDHQRHAVHDGGQGVHEADRGVLICDAPPVSGSSVRRWLRGLRRDGVRDLRRACRKDLIFVTCQPPAM